MAILFSIPADVTDFVMQGQIIGDQPTGWFVDSVPDHQDWAPLMQGGMDWIAEPLPYPTTPPVIDWMPYHASPSFTWPMTNIATGEIITMPIGAVAMKPVSLAIVPEQMFLMSGLPTDCTGTFCPMGALPVDSDQSMPAVEMDLSQGPDVYWESLTPIQLPRLAIQMAGYGTHRNPKSVPSLPDCWGQIKGDWYVESTVRWFINGTLVDSITSAAVPSATVYLLNSAKMTTPSIDQYGNAIVAMGTSDASGAFSFQTTNLDPYMVMAYLDGTPDKSGTSRHDLRDTSVTVYMRDPTVVGGGGTKAYAFIS